MNDGVCTISEVDFLVDQLVQIKEMEERGEPSEKVMTAMDKLKEDFYKADLNPRDFLYFMTQFQKMLIAIKPDDMEMEDIGLENINPDGLNDEEIALAILECASKLDIV